MEKLKIGDLKKSEGVAGRVGAVQLVGDQVWVQMNTSLFNECCGFWLYFIPCF